VGLQIFAGHAFLMGPVVVGIEGEADLSGPVALGPYDPVSGESLAYEEHCPDPVPVFAREFAKAAAEVVERTPDRNLQSAVNNLVSEEDSTMVLLTWDREIDLRWEMGETM
jgi:hypothetical protein